MSPEERPVTATAWSRLGIEATVDQAAIRRAYAAQLKAIDADADPAAFIALREALDEARHRAAHLAQPDLQAPLAEAVEPEVVQAVAEPLGVEIRPQWLEDIEAVQSLVFGEESREAIFAEVTERTRRIIAAPEMDSIDHAARVERWAAETILSGIPRTNGMLEPAINGFGWLKIAGRWDCPPLVAGVLNRYDDCQLLARVQSDTGGAGEAYRLLTDPAQRPRRRHAEAVERFVNLMRLRHPTIEAELSEEAIAAWDAYLEKRHNAPAARFRRKMEAAKMSAGRIAGRLYLGVVFKVLIYIGGGLLLFALALGTHGVALLFIVPALIRSTVARDD